MNKGVFGVILTLLVVLISSCSERRSKDSKDSDKGSEEAVVDSVEIDTTVPPIIPEPDVISGRFSGNVFQRSDTLILHLLEAYDTISNRRVILPERFSFLQSKKFVFSHKSQFMLKDSTYSSPKAFLWLFSYNDTTQMKLIKRNWFMEFGDSRSEIIQGQPTTIKGPPYFVVFFEKEMAILVTDCQDYSGFSWRNLIESFGVLFRTNRLSAIKVDCYGNLRWL